MSHLIRLGRRRTAGVSREAQALDPNTRFTQEHAMPLPTRAVHSGLATIATRLLVALPLAVAAASLQTTDSSAQTSGSTATEPRYVVSGKSIKAIDETGPDIASSDQIYGGFQLTDPAQKFLGSFRSQLFLSFDTGETKTLQTDKNCAPASEFLELKSGHSFLDARFGDRWGCFTSTGIKAPFTLQTKLFEQNGCPPNTSNCLTSTHRTDVLSRVRVSDETLPGQPLVFTPQGLAADLPTVSSQRDYSVDHRGDGGHYRTTITVKRVS